MELFPFIKVFFSKPKEYEKLKAYDKKRHKFMLQRFMSIRYPEAAQAFNINKINPLGVIDSWHKVAVQFKRVPGWIYTRVRKKKKVKEKKVFEPMESTVKYYMERNEIGNREYKEALKFNKEGILKELKDIESQINVL